MSINTNRARLKGAVNNHQYRIIWINFEYPIYWDEGIRYHQSKGIRNRWKKRVQNYEYRMYRTWKYNRKTQWKE